MTTRPKWLQGRANSSLAAWLEGNEDQIRLGSQLKENGLIWLGQPKTACKGGSAQIVHAALEQNEGI